MYWVDICPDILDIVFVKYPVEMKETALIILLTCSFELDCYNLHIHVLIHKDCSQYIW